MENFVEFLQFILATTLTFVLGFMILKIFNIDPNEKN